MLFVKNLLFEMNSFGRLSTRLDTKEKKWELKKNKEKKWELEDLSKPNIQMEIPKEWEGGVKNQMSMGQKIGHNRKGSRSL